MKPTRYYSNLQEEYVAKVLGGKQQSNSGAANFTSSDVVIKDLMNIECKTTTKENLKSFAVKKQWLEDMEHERLDLMLPYCALAISYSPEGDDNYYIINEGLMKKLISYLEG